MVKPPCVIVPIDTMKVLRRHNPSEIHLEILYLIQAAFATEDANEKNRFFRNWFFWQGQKNLNP